MAYTELRCKELGNQIKSRVDSITGSIETITAQGKALAALEVTAATVTKLIEGLNTATIAATLARNGNAADIKTNKDDIKDSAAKILANSGNIRSTCEQVKWILCTSFKDCK